MNRCYCDFGDFARGRDAHGETTAMRAQKSKKPGLTGLFDNVLDGLVAGVGFEPTTFGL
jgi:hypothetical protein